MIDKDIVKSCVSEMNTATPQPKSEVYLMDCVEGMKQYPDNHFDLAVVDPPYGIDVTKMEMGGRKRNKYDKKKNWDNGVPSDEYFNELKRVSKNQIIWGGNYFKELPIFNPKLKRKVDFLKVDGIIWDKGETMYGRDFSECEIAYTTLNKGIFKISPNQLLRIHPTQKPVKLYDWIYSRYTGQGQKILDTHLGSGSNRIAANKAGLDFTGFEIDEDYFGDSNERFRKFVAQSRLF
jgi:site-specific DNA-methyltransferase (adenine-specific)